MRNDISDDDHKMIFKPCIKCGSTSYDNCDFKLIEEDKDGNDVIQPTACDKCTFELLLSESDQYH